MRRIFYGLFCLLFLLSSCAGSPPTLPHLDQETPEPGGCPTLFPQGNYQYVHLIEFSMPGGKHGIAMGVTVIKDGTIHSTLMTVEGFVLFSAVFSDSLIINRAVPPFNKPGFAEGMMEDIKAIFSPSAGEARKGFFPGKQPVCRVTDGKRQRTDVFVNSNGCHQRNLYLASGQLLCTITGTECSKVPGVGVIPKKLILTSRQSGGYTLTMTLLNVEKLE